MILYSSQWRPFLHLLTEKHVQCLLSEISSVLYLTVDHAPCGVPAVDLVTTVHGEMNVLLHLVFAFIECEKVKQAKKILEVCLLFSTISPSSHPSTLQFFHTMSYCCFMLQIMNWRLCFVFVCLMVLSQYDIQWSFLSMMFSLISFQAYFVTN